MRTKSLRRRWLPNHEVVRLGLRIVAGKAWSRRLRSSGRVVLVVAFVIAVPWFLQAQGVRPADLPDVERDRATVNILLTPGVWPPLLAGVSYAV